MLDFVVRAGLGMGNELFDFLTQDVGEGALEGLGRTVLIAGIDEDHHAMCRGARRRIVMQREDEVRARLLGHAGACPQLLAASTGTRHHLAIIAPHQMHLGP